MSIKKTINFWVIAFALCFVGMFLNVNNAKALTDPNGIFSYVQVGNAIDSTSKSAYSILTTVQENSSIYLYWTPTKSPADLGVSKFLIYYACGSDVNDSKITTNVSPTYLASIPANGITTYYTSWTAPAYNSSADTCKFWIYGVGSTCYSYSCKIYGPNTAPIEITQTKTIVNPIVATVSVSPSSDVALDSYITFRGSAYNISTASEAGFYVFPYGSAINTNNKSVYSYSFTAPSTGSGFSTYQYISSNSFSAGKTYCIRAYVGSTQAPSNQDACFTTKSVSTAGYSCDSGYACTSKASGAVYTISNYGSDSAAKTACEANTTCHSSTSGNYFYYCSGTGCYKTSQTFTSSASCYDAYKTSCYSSSNCDSSCSKASPYCGDGTCNGTETPSTCSSDCKTTTPTWGYSCLYDSTAGANQCKYANENAVYKAYQLSLGKEDWTLAYNNCSTNCKNVSQGQYYYYCSNGCKKTDITFNNASDCYNSYGVACYTSNTCESACQTQPTPYCGDGTCNGTETPSTCSSDCKAVDTSRQLSFCGTDNTCHNITATMASCQAFSTNASKTCYEGYNCNGNTCSKTIDTSGYGCTSGNTVCTPVGSNAPFQGANAKATCEAQTTCHVQVNTVLGQITTKSYANNTLTVKGKLTSGTASQASFAVYATGVAKASSVIYPILLNQEFTGTISGLADNTTYTLVLYIDGAQKASESYTTGTKAPDTTVNAVIDSATYNATTKRGEISGRITSGTANQAYARFNSPVVATGVATISNNQFKLYTDPSALPENNKYSFNLYIDGVVKGSGIIDTTTKVATTVKIDSATYSPDTKKATISGTILTGQATNAYATLNGVKTTAVSVANNKFSIISDVLAGGTTYTAEIFVDGMSYGKATFTTPVEKAPVTAKITNATYNSATKKATVYIQTTGFDQTYYAVALFGVKGITGFHQAPITPQLNGNVASLPSSFEIPHSSDSYQFQQGKYQVYYEIREFNTNKLLTTSNTYEFEIASNPTQLDAPKVFIENIYDDTNNDALITKKPVTVNSTKVLVYATAYVKYFDGGMQYATYETEQDIASNTVSSPKLIDSGSAIMGQEQGTTNYVAKINSKYSPTNFNAKRYCFEVRARKISNDPNFTNSDWGVSNQICVVDQPWVITDQAIYSQDGKTVAIKGRITNFASETSLNGYFKMYAKGYENYSIKKSYQSNPLKAPAPQSFIENVNPYAYDNINVPTDAWNKFCYKACAEKITGGGYNPELCGAEVCFDRKTIKSIDYLKINNGTAENKSTTGQYDNLFYSWPVDTFNRDITAKYWFVFYKKDNNGNVTPERTIQATNSTLLFGTSANAIKNTSLTLNAALEDQSLLKTGALSYCVTPFIQATNSTDQVSGNTVCYPTLKAPDALTASIDSAVYNPTTKKGTISGTITSGIGKQAYATLSITGSYIATNIASISNNKFTLETVAGALKEGQTYNVSLFVTDNANKTQQKATGVLDTTIKSSFVLPATCQTETLDATNVGKDATNPSTYLKGTLNGKLNSDCLKTVQNQISKVEGTFGIYQQGVYQKDTSPVTIYNDGTFNTALNIFSAGTYSYDARVYVYDLAGKKYTVPAGAKKPLEIATPPVETFKVLSPNGGETFKIGDTINVQLQKSSPTDPVSIYLQDDQSGTPKNTLVNSAPITGTTYPLVITKDLLAKLSTTKTSGSKYLIDAYVAGKSHDVSDNYFTINDDTQSNLAFDIVSPTEGTKLKLGDSVTVQWTNKSLPTTAKVILVMLPTPSTDLMAKLLATDAKVTDSKYTFKIDDALIKSFESQDSTGKTKIEDLKFSIIGSVVNADWSQINGKTITDTSGSFTITKNTSGVLSFDITNPVDGDIIKEGDSAIIKWTQNSLPANTYLSLVLKTDDGKVNSILTSVVLSSNLYTIKIDKNWINTYETKYGNNVENANFYVEGWVKDSSGNVFATDKSGKFKIKKNTGGSTDDQDMIQIIYPNGGETLKKGDTIDITWKGTKSVLGETQTGDKVFNTETEGTLLLQRMCGDGFSRSTEIANVKISDKKYKWKVDDFNIYGEGGDKTSWKNCKSYISIGFVSDLFIRDFDMGDNPFLIDPNQDKSIDTVTGFKIKTIKPTTDANNTVLLAEVLEMPAGKTATVKWIATPKDDTTKVLTWSLVDASNKLKSVSTKGTLSMKLTGTSFLIDGKISNYCFTAVGVIDGKEEKAENTECIQ